ncbi:pilin [Dyella sp. Tek66A03]|uniref:pilin n=1 Tax=Dyella sp. Tek66A03 TaxID=3458298 RepID=UPI00403E72F4
MKNVQKGFTLIELMIVVAIIAILAAIAIPQYQNYITKSQFSETQTIADGLKTPIVEYANQTGQCPTNGTIGFSAAGSYKGKFVSGATLAGAYPACTITVNFIATAGSVSAPLTANAAGVLFTGTNNGGTFSWTCQDTTLAAKYKPTVCQ